MGLVGAFDSSAILVVVGVSDGERARYRQ